MDEKREIQKKIVQTNPNKITDEEFVSVLKMIAPGTNLRTALEGILKYGKGALIAIENPELLPILDGGFRINAKFTPQRIVELSKMDGAMVLSKDLKKITHSNVLLTPDSKIKTVETGTRHKAAERTAKQIQGLVIAISERKNEITVYYKNLRYTVESSGDLLRKANEHIQLLEKQRELFDIYTEKLTQLELRNYPSLSQALNLIQKGALINKISSNLQKYIIELGKEGILLKTRLKELTSEVEKETMLAIKDYAQTNQHKAKMILDEFGYEDILDKEKILKILLEDTPITSATIPSKGWRILSKTSLSEKEIASVLAESKSLGKAIHANLPFYKTILGEEKGLAIKQELDKIKLNF